MTKRRYSREFKVSAVQLVEQRGYSVRDAAKSLGVDPHSLRSWIKRFGAEAVAAPNGEAALRLEVRRLRQENQRLLMEREILKKAAAYFARQEP